MGSVYQTARIAITVIASAVTTAIIVPVVGEFFIGMAKERHLYDKPDQWPERAMSGLLAISELPWLRAIALFLVGLTIGLWIDTIARRKSARRPIVKNWLPLGEALSVFVPAELHSSLADARQHAKAVGEQIVDLWKQMEDLKLGLLGTAPQPEETELELKKLADRRRAAEIETGPAGQAVAIAQRQIDETLVAQLAAGSLVARGLPRRDHVLSEEVEIPAAYWRVLVIDRNDQKLQTVGGDGVLYVGVRVGRPS
jgi:hypothetical protein